MKLIIGGAYQGKLAFALRLAGAEKTSVSVADGSRDPFEAAFCRDIVYNLHEYIRRLCEGVGGQEAEVFLHRLMDCNPTAIVVCNLLGCGIVPVAERDRLWREATGRACRSLADCAKEVYRVLCGIPQKLKGEDV